ncbi:MAG: hypothetical protein SGBAC_002536 [Bacillariaceae sp.]
MYINKRIAKAFAGAKGESVIYFGMIDKVTQPTEPFYWHVVYDDGDEEEFDEKDILRALTLYQMHRKDDTEYEGPNASVVDGLSSQQQQLLQQQQQQNGGGDTAEAALPFATTTAAAALPGNGAN